MHICECISCVYYMRLRSFNVCIFLISFELLFFFKFSNLTVLYCKYNYLIIILHTCGYVSCKSLKLTYMYPIKHCWYPYICSYYLHFIVVTRQVSLVKQELWNLPEHLIITLVSSNFSYPQSTLQQSGDILIMTRQIRLFKYYVHLFFPIFNTKRGYTLALIMTRKKWICVCRSG